MKKDIQRAILRACARFIGKKLEPVDGRLKQVEAIAAKAATAQSSMTSVSPVSGFRPTARRPGSRNSSLSSGRGISSSGRGRLHSSPRRHRSKKSG